MISKTRVSGSLNREQLPDLQVSALAREKIRELEITATLRGKLRIVKLLKRVRIFRSNSSIQRAAVLAESCPSAQRFSLSVFGRDRSRTKGVLRNCPRPRRE